MGAMNHGKVSVKLLGGKSRKREILIFELLIPESGVLFKTTQPNKALSGKFLLLNVRPVYQYVSCEDSRLNELILQ